MISIYIYNIKTMLLAYVRTGAVENAITDIADGFDFTLTPPPDYNHVWRWVGDEWVELLPINNPDTPYNEQSIWDEKLNQWVDCPELSAHKLLKDQEQAWERIKQRRYEAITSGVYVASIDKRFHTDETSVTTYSTIAGMVALDNYEPVQWKTMDNEWFLLTVPLFKELQTAMSLKTNENYEVAENHKAAMLLSDEPLEYDYSTNWV